MPVAVKQKRRGISMGMRVLLFSSLLLVALPWLGYRYVSEMKEFLLRGQEDAQLLTAKAVATVLHGRADLFYPVDESVDVGQVREALYVYPLANPVEIDGYSDDWGTLVQQARKFDLNNVVFNRSEGESHPAPFSLLLGEHGRYVYALLHVRDRNIIYRNPKYRRLDHSDHVRMEILEPDGNSRRLILITEGEGQISVYDMKPDWKLPLTGKPVYAVFGEWREGSDGYYLEMRLPASWVKAQPYMTISVANVDSIEERRVDTVVATLNLAAADRPNLLITRSPELGRILQGLGSAEAGICVVDRYRRIRAVYGLDNDIALCTQKDSVSAELVDEALTGSREVARYTNTVGDSILVAAYPVYSDDEVMGAVLIEKNSRHILGLQHKSLMRIIVATLVVFLAAILGLMLFAAWFAYRIRKLQKEASDAIDEEGRVIKAHLYTDQFAVDEIGQLSRDFSSVLTKLKNYTGFLESIPRTLRHEILNPVNTISMSLQKLEPDENNEPLLNSARLATRQLEMIVQSLTEAAHIDEALLQDENEIFDLAAMVSEYVANSKLKHGSARIRYKGPESGIFISGSGLRIAQLMDKVKDNALDFSDEASPVIFELTREGDKARLFVTNHGPVVSDEVLDTLFAGITSSRPADHDQPHLGIGLFIASRIAQQHQGELKIRNLYNMDGVEVMLTLPVAE